MWKFFRRWCRCRTQTEAQCELSPVAAQLASFRENLSVAGVTGQFALYQQAVETLAAAPAVGLVPLGHILDRPGPGVARIAFRHDLDIDHRTGLRCARFLARHGVPGSFYLLHTAYYYGCFEGKRFSRDPFLAAYIRDLALTGVEVGLHIDPLRVYHEFGMDGAHAVTEELTWIRGLGVPVRSTVGHNSAPVYGAENFEIYAGKSARARLRKTGHKSIRLQSLDEAALGLEYEANFPAIRDPLDMDALERFASFEAADAVRDRDWMRIYLRDHPIFERAYDVTCWHCGGDAWVVCSHGDAPPRYDWNLTTAEVLDLYRGGAMNGLRSVFVWHPIYICQ